VSSALVETPAAGLDHEAVRHALDGVRRRVRAHAGDVEVVSVSKAGDVTLAFTGTCAACPAQAMTLGAAVLPVIESLPGVRSISVKGMAVSAAAMRRIQTMFGHAASSRNPE